MFKMISPDTPQKYDSCNPIYSPAPINPRAFVFFVVLSIAEYRMSWLFSPFRELYIILMLSTAISLLHAIHSDRGVLLPPKEVFLLSIDLRSSSEVLPSKIVYPLPIRSEER